MKTQTMSAYGHSSEHAQSYTRLPSIHRDQQRNAAPRGTSSRMAATRPPSNGDMRVQSLRPNVDPGVVVMGGGLGNLGSLMSVVGVRPTSRERRAPTNSRAGPTREPAGPELAFGIVGSGVTVLAKRPPVRMTGSALPGGGGPRWSGHTAHSVRSLGAAKRGRSVTDMAKASVTIGHELPPGQAEGSPPISGVATPVHSGPASLAMDDPIAEATGIHQTATTLAGKTNAVLPPTRATRCSTGERELGSTHTSGNESSKLERSDGSTEDDSEGDESTEEDLEEESEADGDEDNGMDEDEDEHRQQASSSSDTESGCQSTTEEMFSVDPNGCSRAATEEVTTTSTAPGDGDVSEPIPPDKKHMNEAKSKKRKKKRRLKRRKAQTAVNARLRDFSSRVAKAVQAVADSRASAVIDEEATDTRPWRHCMATPKQIAAESQEDQMAKEDVPQLSEEEKSAIRAAAVEAAKKRVKRARKKQGEELDGDEPRRSSKLAPTAGEAAAALRTNAVLIASKARSNRAVASRSVQSVDSSQQAPKNSANSESRKLDRTRDSSQPLSLVGTMARSSESPLRRRTALLRSKQYCSVSEETGRSVEVMSPRTLEKFQKDQQEKAKARIRERKMQVEEDGRKQAEAEEQQRAASKTHHLEVQEAKAQRRAELYMLNAILRRKEFRGFELYMARNADCPLITSGPAKTPTVSGTTKPAAHSSPDPASKPAQDPEPESKPDDAEFQLTPQQEPEPASETDSCSKSQLEPETRPNSEPASPAVVLETG